MESHNFKLLDQAATILDECDGLAEEMIPRLQMYIDNNQCNDAEELIYMSYLIGVLKTKVKDEQ